MELTPLPGVLLCLSIPLIFLWRGLVFLSLSFVLWAMFSLSLLMWWVRMSKVSLVLLLKFLLNFDNIPIGRSK